MLLKSKLPKEKPPKEKRKAERGFGLACPVFWYLGWGGKTVWDLEYHWMWTTVCTICNVGKPKRATACITGRYTRV